MKAMTLLIFLLAALAVGPAGCGGASPVPVEAGGEGMTVRLVIDLPRGDLPGSGEAVLMLRIESRLAERGIGIPAGTLARAGALEVTFRVNDPGRARRAMETVMAAEAPGRKYRVSVAPPAQEGR